MEQPWAVALAFAGGWLLREWSTPQKVEEPASCHCQCSFPVSPAPEHVSSSSSSWLVALVAIVLLVVFGNTALALRISYQDSTTGQDKTVSVAVKGKSKGVYNSPVGLTVAN